MRLPFYSQGRSEGITAGGADTNFADVVLVQSSKTMLCYTSNLVPYTSIPSGGVGSTRASPQVIWGVAGIPFDPPKKYSGSNITEYSMKVEMEAFENKYRFKIYMGKTLHKIYFKVIAWQQTF